MPQPPPASASANASVGGSESGGSAPTQDQGVWHHVPWKTVGWVATGAGAVGLAVGAAFGIAAINDHNAAHCNASKQCLTGPLDDAKSAATASNVGLVVGAVLAAGGVGLVLFAPGRADGSSKAHRAATAVLTPEWTPGWSRARTGRDLVMAMSSRSWMVFAATLALTGCNLVLGLDSDKGGLASGQGGSAAVGTHSISSTSSGGSEGSASGSSGSGSSGSSSGARVGSGSSSSGSSTGGVGCMSCTIMTLASEQSNPSALAVDANSVYWVNYSDTGTVMKVAKNGGQPSPDARDGPSGSAQHRRRLRQRVLGERHSIRPHEGPHRGRAGGAIGSVGGTGLAVDATSAYVAADGDGFVAKEPLSAGNVTALATTYAEPYALAIDASNVYWVNEGTGAGGSVMKVSQEPVVGELTPTLKLASAQRPLGIAIDSTSVYWTDSLAGTVMSVPLGGGTPVTLASGQASPSGIAVSEGYVYWTNNVGNGSVMKVSIAGGQPETLAASTSPLAIAVDETSVYWSSSTANGTIMKLTPK